jgi:hypothetical protein
MEKQQIIKIFLERGYQLDLDALEHLYKNEKDVDLLTRGLAELKSPAITMGVLKQVLKKPIIDIKIIKQKQTKIGKVSVEHFAQLLTHRYNFVKKILETRLDLVNPISINKISPKTKKFSLIAVVKEKNEDTGSILVEDNTGETTLHLKSHGDFNELIVDDIVGLVSVSGNDIIEVERIVFPDISLKKEVSKSKEDIHCLFLSDILFDHPNFKKESFDKFLDWLNKSNYPNFIIFILGNISSDNVNLRIFFEALPKKSVKIFMKNETDADTDLADMKIQSPCFMEVGGVGILLCNDSFLVEYKKMFNKAIDGVLLNLLKRRILDPSIDRAKEIYENDPFLIETIPNIIVAGNVFEPIQLNYKSTTILANGSFISTPVAWLLNLKTREFIKLDFK